MTAVGHSRHSHHPDASGSPQERTQISAFTPCRGEAMLPGMSDDPLRTKPEPPQGEVGSIISLADRDQELRHEAARRLAQRHNASLRQQAPEDATA